MNKAKIQIKDVPYVYLNSDLFKGEIEDVANKILSIRKKLEEEHLKRKAFNHPIKITPFEEYKYVDLDLFVDRDNSIEVYITVFRDETDEEYSERLKENKKRSESAKLSAEKRKENIINREKKLLEQLKKKYEG